MPLSSQGIFKATVTSLLFPSSLQEFLLERIAVNTAASKNNFVSLVYILGVYIDTKALIKCQVTKPRIQIEGIYLLPGKSQYLKSIRKLTT